VVTVAAVRPGGDPAAASPVTVPVFPAGQPHDAVLTADGVGAWEVAVSDGAETARIPVAVAAPAPTPGWTWAVRIGAVVGVVALVAALALRHRPRVAVAVGAVAIAGVTVAVTAAATAPAPASAPAASPVPGPAPAGGHAGHGGTGGMWGMAAPAGDPAPMAAPRGGVVVDAAPTGPATAGAPVDLVLDLTDSSTGAVVDDLAIHDDALIHLAVVGPDGQLSHVHPVRAAPGHYVVRLVPATAGRYGVFAEMERAGDGGHQVARTAVDVAGPAPAVATPAPGPGVRQVGDLQADVAVPDAVAGRPTRITATFSRGGAPVTDLQGWLGMAAHLVVLGPGLSGAPDPADPASSFGHVHDMAAAGPGGTYGPQVGFDLTFPQPGRHQLWVQVQRGWRIVTVPVTVDVAPATTAAP
jgi:hypothetical protein